MNKLTLDVWKDPSTGEWILSKGRDIVIGLSQISSETMRHRIADQAENSNELTLEAWQDPRTGEWILSKGDKIIIGLKQLTSETMRQRIGRLLDQTQN